MIQWILVANCIEYFVFIVPLLGIIHQFIVKGRPLL
jgi:hypothetical protein